MIHARLAVLRIELVVGYLVVRLRVLETRGRTFVPLMQVLLVVKPNPG